MINKYKEPGWINQTPTFPLTPVSSTGQALILSLQGRGNKIGAYAIRPYKDGFPFPVSTRTGSAGMTQGAGMTWDARMTINYLAAIDPPYCLRHHRLNDTPPIHP